jgi:hypothetical protein
MSMRESSLRVLLFALRRLLVDRVLTLLVVRGVGKSTACLRA